MSRVIATVCIVLFAASCDSKSRHHEHGEAHAEVCTDGLTQAEWEGNTIVEQPGAEVGDYTRCPISGSVFQVSAESAKVVQKGKNYYTCCPGCTAQLEKSFARRR